MRLPTSTLVFILSTWNIFAKRGWRGAADVLYVVFLATVLILLILSGALGKVSSSLLEIIAFPKGWPSYLINAVFSFIVGSTFTKFLFRAALRIEDSAPFALQPVSQKQKRDNSAICAVSCIGGILMLSLSYLLVDPSRVYWLGFFCPFLSAAILTCFFQHRQYRAGPTSQFMRAAANVQLPPALRFRLWAAQIATTVENNELSFWWALEGNDKARISKAPFILTSAAIATVSFLVLCFASIYQNQIAFFVGSALVSTYLLDLTMDLGGLRKSTLRQQPLNFTRFVLVGLKPGLAMTCITFFVLSACGLLLGVYSLEGFAISLMLWLGFTICFCAFLIGTGGVKTLAWTKLLLAMMIFGNTLIGFGAATFSVALLLLLLALRRARKRFNYG